MNIGSAFTFTFEDRNWVRKLAIGGGMALGAFSLSPILVGLVLFLPIGGYVLEALENVRDGWPSPLPEWGHNMGRLFARGSVVFAIWLVYNIPALLVTGASIGVNISASGLDPEATIALGIVAVGLSCVQFAFSLLGNALFPGALIHYARDNKPGAAFRFGEIVRLITGHPRDYLIVIIVVWMTQLAALLGLLLGGVGFFFIGFWSALVAANLYGQLARKARWPAGGGPRRLLILPPPARSM